MFYRHWFHKFLLLITLGFLGVATVNLLVDPYGMYRLLEIDGFNTTKHTATDHTRDIKHYLVRKQAARGLALGNSRVEIALDPQHPGWSREAQPVYNYGLPGGLINEMLGNLEEIEADCDIKQLVVGLDFFMFSASGYGHDRSPLAKYDFDPRAFRLTTLFSLHTLWDSLNSLVKQDRFRYPDYREDGMIAESFKANRVARDGYRATFHWSEEHYFEWRPKFVAVSPKNGASGYDALRQLLDFARSRQIDLRLYLSPMHARYYELLRIGGQWEQYEEWKRTLVRVLAEDALRHPKAPPITLWDFSGYNTVTTEPVPPLEDRQTTMQYYWETSHFTKAVGDLILDRVFGVTVPGRVVPDDFGVPLDQQNLEARLATIRAQGEAYRRERRAELEDIDAMKRRFWGD